MNVRRGIRPLFSDKGIPLDRLRERMIEDGYLPPEPEDAPATQDLNDVWDLVSKALGGEMVAPMNDAKADELRLQAQPEDSSEADNAALEGAKQRLLDSGLSPDDLAVELDWLDGAPTAEKIARLSELAREREGRSDEGIALDQAAIGDPETVLEQRGAATKEAFENRIDELFAGERASSNGVKMLDEGDVLTITGYGNMPVHLNESHAIAHTDHPLTAEQWKKVPEWLDNPVAVFEQVGGKNDGHLLFIAPEKVDGKLVLMAMEPKADNPAHPAGMPATEHLLLTAYTKGEGTTPFAGMIESGKLKPLYADKRFGPKWFENSGGQFPGNFELLRAANRSLKTGRDLVKYRAERGLLQAADSGPQGQITFGHDASGAMTRAGIRLFDTADKSTFMHEMAHFLLEMMGDLAADPNTEQGLKDDYAKIRQWIGVPEGEAIQTEHHERWARSFEAYLLEGKAPSPELVGAFARVRRWFTDIYKSMQSLIAAGAKPLDDDIRAVMDRILATDEETELASKRNGLVPKKRPAHGQASKAISGQPNDCRFKIAASTAARMA